MERGPDKQRQIKRALLIADLGLILALVIVLYAISHHWVEPKQPPDESEPAAVQIVETIVPSGEI